MGRVWVRRRKDRKGRPWVCAWNTHDGDRHQRTFPTRDEADVFAAKKQLELGQATPVPPVDLNITVREYRKRWLEDVAPGLKRSTVRSYRELLEHHVLPSLGLLRVRDVHQQHVVGLLGRKLATGQYSENTVRLIYATVRRMLSRARFEGLVQVNVAQGLWKELPFALKHKRRARRRSKDEIKAMTRRQLDSFLRSAVEDPRHFALFLLLARTGCRMGEALALQLGDIDLEQKELSVRRSLAAAQRGLSLEERLDLPKSGAERSVDISGELAGTLEHQCARMHRQNLRRGVGQEPGAWLFTTTEGTPMDETRVRRAFKATLKRARLPLRFTPHSLRHTYATLMLSAGAPLTWVSRQLGHSSPQVTLDWYWWALPGGEKKHADLLDTPRDRSLPIAASSASPVTNGDQTAPPAVVPSPQVIGETGAGARTRTEDLLITNQLLYH